MKHFFAKIARFFWSWGFLKFVLWTITIIILFYVEEDWRGARAWAATKAEWEAKGESFDYAKLVPPPVPDEQNLALIPLFKAEPDPEYKGAPGLLTLSKAFRRGMPGNNLQFHTGNWQAGQVSDMDKIRKGIAADYVEAFQGNPPGGALAQFDALYPFVEQLRAAAVTRPSFRLPHEYPPLPPYDFIATVTPQIQMAKILNLHALLALDAHKPDVALSDIQLNLTLASGLTKEPFIVSGLVAIGMTAIGFGSIYDGLTLHAWNDAQLTALQNALAQIDFLSDYQHSLRGEMGLSLPNIDSLKLDRPRLADLLKPHDEIRLQYPENRSKLRRVGTLTNWWPDGWIDWNKVQIVTQDLNGVRYVDATARLVFPERVNELSAENSKRTGIIPYGPWNIFAALASPVIISEAQKFSIEQVWIDEARIACALERYRLVHGAYPDSLDALVPACIAALPHDILSGQPYRYRLRSDGKFELYSVGWNQTDDGGNVIYKKDAPAQFDYNSGDWVWPMPQVSR